MSESTATENGRLEAALGYARRGWRVVRLLPGQKRPVEEDWPTLATTDPAVIREWPPDCNVGIALGPASGLVDFEGDGDGADATLFDLFDGDVPVTPVFEGRRGKHRLFAWSDGLPFKAVVHLGDLEVRLGAGGKGAQSVFPPSVHPSGKPYRWLPGCSPDDVDPPPIPAEVVRRLNEAAGRTKAPDAPAADLYRAEPVREGERNTAVYHEAIALWSEQYNLNGHRCFESAHVYRVVWTRLVGLNAVRCKPPLPETEVRSCCESARRYVAGGAHEEDTEKDAVCFQGVLASELAKADYDVRFLIQDSLVDLQPCIVGGPAKTCKTLLATDAAVSLATATPFLGELIVHEAARVGYMSGEGGLSVLQDYARRVAEGRGWRLGDIGGLVFCDTLPQLSDLEHVKALEKFLTDWELSVAFLDPLYLCMPGDDAHNLMKTGKVLRYVNQVCLRAGCTPILLHHLKKNVTDPFAPPELADLAWAGFDAFAGQWWLIGRREKYTGETPGQHKLWLNVGGRAGHSGLHAVDIDEGKHTDPEGRYWEVQIKRARDARREAENRAEEAKRTKAEEAMKQNLAKLCRTLARFPDGTTLSQLAIHAGMSTTRARPLLAELLDRGDVITCEVRTGNHRTPKEGYRLAN
jgi:hypothetical protein